MHQGRELHGWRETAEEPNPFAARRTERAAKVVDRFDGNTLPENRGLEHRGLVAWIARSLARLGKRLAVRLLHVKHVRHTKAQHGSRLVALGVELASSHD